MIRILALFLLLQYSQPTRVPTFSGPSCAANGIWKMTEGSGLTLNDTSGNSNTATINTGSSVVWTANNLVTGKTTPVWQGTGFALATSTTLTNFDGTQPFSAVMWLETAKTAEQAVMGNLNATGGTFQGWEMNMGWNGAALVPQFFIINNYPSNAIFISGTSPISLSTVHFLAMTYDPTVAGGGCTTKCAAGASIYIDGILQPPVVLDNTLTGSTANGLPLRFGARNDGSDELAGGAAFAGTYPCVLTPTKIAACFAAGPSVC